MPTFISKCQVIFTWRADEDDRAPAFPLYLKFPNCAWHDDMNAFILSFYLKVEWFCLPTVTTRSCPECRHKKEISIEFIIFSKENDISNLVVRKCGRPYWIRYLELFDFRFMTSDSKTPLDQIWDYSLDFSKILPVILNSDPPSWNIQLWLFIHS